MTLVSFFVQGECTMSKRSDEKKALILECAERVFIKKGFASVTMKDIIEETDISRGGIYLYFKSVDEVFTEVIEIHNTRKLENIKSTVKNSNDFNTLVDNYFEMQKNRLLHMDRSLRRAMTEYFLMHKEESPDNFYADQYHNSKKIILEILKTGCSESVADTLSDLIMFEIEGLETMALLCDISPALIDTQFNLLKELIHERKNK
jgi:AcrR family transcriptional regulator